MPSDVRVAAFIFGAALSLIALLGGGFEFLGIKITATVGKQVRIFAGIIGPIFVVLALLNSFAPQQTPASQSTAIGAPTTTALNATAVLPTEVLPTEAPATEVPAPVQASNWQPIDENPDTDAIVADGSDVYQIHRTGKIWKYTGQPGNWQLLDNNPASKQIAAGGGNLYQRHIDGKIRKYTGQPLNWQLIDENPDTVAIVADGSDLYQLHRTGKIWKYIIP